MSLSGDCMVTAFALDNFQGAIDRLRAPSRYASPRSTTPRP
jgi:hypothetical protein